MSEETAQKLKEAEGHLSSMEDEATVRKNELLIAVAERLPGHARQLAKRTGQSEPDITRALGTEGIKELRSQLEDLASELAADIAGAVSEVTWPKPSHFSPVKPNDVRKSLFEFMYGQKMTKFAKVFKDHGFNTYDGNNRGHQSLVLPQSFFSEDEIAEEIKALGTALMAVTKAEMAVEAAKKADDLAAVDDLWGD